MKAISAEQLLQQIRTLNAELNAGAAAAPPAAGEPGFQDVLRRSLDSVNALQQNAAELKRGFETGQGRTTLAEVMVAAQKADLSFRAMTEVRNKLVAAYQEIMNMPI